MAPRLLTRGLPLLVLAIPFILPSEAHARKRGFFLITTGETVKHMGDVQAEAKPLVQMATNGQDPQVGYLHDRFGILFLDLWTWGGQYCLYKDNEVWALDKEQAAGLMGKSPDDIGTPFWYRVPPLLLIVGVGAVAFVGVKVAERARGGAESGGADSHPA